MDGFLSNLIFDSVIWLILLSIWFLGNRLSTKAKYRAMLALSIITTPAAVLGALIFIVAPFFNSPVARDELIVFWAAGLICLFVTAVPIKAVRHQRRLYKDEYITSQVSLGE